MYDVLLFICVYNIPNTQYRTSPAAIIIIIIVVEYIISADINDVILVQSTYKTMTVVNTIYNALFFVYAFLNNYV